MADKKLCVIIPVHKSQMNNEERISLLACSKHLKQFDCYLVFPDAMVVSSYLEIHSALILKPVPATWLSSIANYNRMKTSVVFYEMFKDYEFLLTYELDAYIFSSNIEQHYGFEFDFIGAPMFSENANAVEETIIAHGLNSGFSIRKINTSISALKRLNELKPRWKLYRFLYWNIPFGKNLINSKKKFLVKDGYLKAFYRSGYFHEDFIFTQVIPLLYSEFKIASFKNALRFSFEVNPSLLYQMNNRQLPLGCHAWKKHISFWKEHIQQTDKD